MGALLIGDRSSLAETAQRHAVERRIEPMVVVMSDEDVDTVVQAVREMT